MHAVPGSRSWRRALCSASTALCGGMGEVYEAEHTTLERQYALKLLPADFAARPGALERFKNEANEEANLEHPHIVRVDDFGETDGRYWLRLELLGGVRIGPSELAGDATTVTTLGELAAECGGPIPGQLLLPLLRQVLDGLAYAHTRGAIHRDLKPDNILLTRELGGKLRAKIADFGLVRLVGEDWVRSQAELSVKYSLSLRGQATEAAPDVSSSTRSLLGTFEYMSPEQKRGEDATAASDVYTAGLLMYRLLTGRQLDPRPPSYYVDDCPKWLDQLV